MTQQSSGSRIAEDGSLVNVARSAEHAVHRIAETGQRKLSAALDGSRDYVRENPVQSVLVAAGVGALIGFLVSRRQ